MARKKKLIRFAVLSDGEERQLMKVRDRGNELAIVLSHAPQYTDPPYQGQRILEQRYSVHSTSNSALAINQIKQTIRLEGGVLIETVLNAKGPKAGLVQFVFARACPNLASEKHDVIASPRDELVLVGDYTPARQTLTYCVLVGPINGPAFISPHPSFEQVSYDFKAFRLFVAQRIAETPSTRFGRLLHSMSSAPRINREDISNRPTILTDGLDQDGAQKHCLAFLDTLGEMAKILPRD